MDRQSNKLPVAGLSELHRRRQPVPLPPANRFKVAGVIPAPQWQLKRDALTQLLAILGLGASAGIGARSLVGTGNFIRNTQTPGATDFGASVPEPITLPINQDEERDKLAFDMPKQPNDILQRIANILPNISTTKPLGDWWGVPAGIGVGAGATYGGWKLTDWLLKKEREMSQQRDLDSGREGISRCAGRQLSRCDEVC